MLQLVAASLADEHALIDLRLPVGGWYLVDHKALTTCPAEFTPGTRSTREFLAERGDQADALLIGVKSFGHEVE
jgi:hypothetical protein